MPRYSAESAYGDSKGGIYTPSFVASSDDEDENEMMFTGEEDYNYNTGSSGRGDNVVDVNILHSLLTEDDDISTDAKNNNSAIMPPSGLDKLFTEELKHYSNIDTMEEAEHDTKATYVLHYKQVSLVNNGIIIIIIIVCCAFLSLTTIPFMHTLIITFLSHFS